MPKPKTSTKSYWVAGLALAAVMGGPARAGAEEPAPVESSPEVLNAESLGARAFQAYREKRYAEAVMLYEAAHATVPSADALFNIARVYDLGLRDRKRAIAAYQRVLSDPGASSERIRRASERSNALLRAELAEAEQRPTASELALAASDTTPRVAPDRDPPSSWSTQQVAALVVGAAGVTSVAVGSVLGVSVLSKANTANTGCVGNRCSTQQAVDAAKSASTQATFATAGVSIGAALLVTSAALWLLDDDAPPEHDTTGSVRVTPIASARELGLTLAGGW